MSTILEIPEHLQKVFRELLDCFLHEFLLDFGGDLTDIELELVELLDAFVKKEATK